MENQKNKKLVVAITGASGSLYAKLLLDELLACKEQFKEISVVMTSNAKEVWEYELKNKDYQSYPFLFWEQNNFYAPFASGSAGYTDMIICPCSTGMMGRIAGGISNDLISRAADVMMKERRRLVLVVREMPYNMIHLENMRIITQAGGIICPASPSLYHLPKNIEELLLSVVHRVLNLIGIHPKGQYRWNNG
ncbi:MAG: UbiX family flavin prenyltransferase [Bacteroidetes bacterium]|nr:MAG: UbiX family flavin prenyltransferase [Bacteroidota bacterium]